MINKQNNNNECTFFKQVAPGWFDVYKHIYSPNYNLRPESLQGDISLVVIHNISLPPEQFNNQQYGYINQLFTNNLQPQQHSYFATISQNQVSSHFLIQRHGEIIQYVSTHLRAWHAGKSSFQGRENCNDYSIGIELEGSDTTEFTLQQYQQLYKLLMSLKIAHPSLSYITGHSNIAPQRKTDPGEFFNWQQLKNNINNLIVIL